MYACRVILASSLILRSKRPLSTQLTVVCLINSSKHWAYSSLRIWCLKIWDSAIDFFSLYLTNTGFSCLPLIKLCTHLHFQVLYICSAIDGYYGGPDVLNNYLELSSIHTICFQNFPPSSNSLGGNIVFKMSSNSLVLWDADDEGLEDVPSDGGLTDNVDPSGFAKTGPLYFTRENAVVGDSPIIIEYL